VFERVNVEKVPNSHGSNDEQELWRCVFPVHTNFPVPVSQKNGKKTQDYLIGSGSVVHSPVFHEVNHAFFKIYNLALGGIQ